MEHVSFLNVLGFLIVLGICLAMFYKFVIKPRRQKRLSGGQGGNQKPGGDLKRK